MTSVDLLSDTVYREQACKQLDGLLDDCGEFPVQKAQIYGLRQIAWQQPGKVKGFADHQRERARRKQENVSGMAKPSLQAEIDFWTLVGNLCDSTSDWSVRKEGFVHAPTELREENIPAKLKGMTTAERSRRNELRKHQRVWLDEWAAIHIPAFFERFCTHALYRRELQMNPQED